MKSVSNEHKSCEQNKWDNFLSREEQFKELLSNPDADEYFDNPALSIDTVKFTKVCFSYGGPADYLEIFHKDGNVERVVYRYSDWFDTATLEVEETSPLWTYAETIVEVESYN